VRLRPLSFATPAAIKGVPKAAKFDIRAVDP
jgi:hypothetical protein